MSKTQDGSANYNEQCEKYCTGLTQALNKEFNNALKAFDEAGNANKLADDIESTFAVEYKEHEGKGLLLIRHKIKSELLNDSNFKNFKAALDTDVPGFAPSDRPMTNSQNEQATPDDEGYYHMKQAHSIYHVQKMAFPAISSDEQLNAFKKTARDAAVTIVGKSSTTIKALDEQVDNARIEKTFDEIDAEIDATYEEKPTQLGFDEVDVDKLVSESPTQELPPQKAEPMTFQEKLAAKQEAERAESSKGAADQILKNRLNGGSRGGRS